MLNEEKVCCKPGEYIFDVALKNGIEIPHFCYHERLERTAHCRLCVVEVEMNGRTRIMTSCSTKVAEGMIVRTHTPKILDARRLNLELLLANHDLNCPQCPKNLRCKLQAYASDFMIESLKDEVRIKGKRRTVPVDNSSVSIRRDDNRCILCGRCVKMCNDVQTVYAISQNKRGFDTIVTPALGHNMAESACVNCGQCVIVCPTGALTEKSDVQQVIDALNKPEKMLIAQTAPSIRAALGECFGMPVGTEVTGKMVAALRKLGFEKVFDTNLGADICIIEEATEFVKRLNENRNLPMITTCCPAWIKFGEQFFFDELRHMSSCRSPQAIMASLVKTYYAQKIGKDPKDIVLVDIMPCTAKKYEIMRPEFKGEADFVLTTIELGRLIKEMNIDFVNLQDSDFDHPLGESTGAGAIFGHTGGVMEAAVRTAADWLEGKKLKKFEYKKAIGGMDTKKEFSVTIKGKTVKICVVHTLGEARKLMEEIKAGKSPYHFIEIMACYGGCIGGGGQPTPCTKEVLQKRAAALNSVDSKKKIRKSHENPSALKIYKEYLGEFGSEQAHRLLHTTYTRKSYK
ncbi:iron hydrogenase small subunit [Candidatus Woesearchaeota archaeon]|nr:iron hydrogenase small subunit [Candidatus Woesearchaeota archaeon]